MGTPLLVDAGSPDAGIFAAVFAFCGPYVLARAVQVVRRRSWCAALLGSRASCASAWPLGNDLVLRNPSIIATIRID